tara:strand:- start:2350 stop:2964 length:615 start_codon:yes stop_codon:yes gene_type:complete
MEFLFLIVILIFSVVVHEVSHGVVANSLGDPTAKNAGRLTLNPIPHLDPIGSLLVPGFLILMSTMTGGGIIFGWAKPVPVNPFNLRDRYGSAKVSLAGPGSNLLIALVFGMALRFLPIFEWNPMLFEGFVSIVYINILLALFNLIPIPPLDGSHILFTFLPDSMNQVKVFLSKYGIFVLLGVIFLIPGILSFFVNTIFKVIVGI